MIAPRSLEATINGQRFSFSEGETILTVAKQNGIDIPTLCFANGLPPEGGCRLCIVELTGGKLAGACHTPIQADTRIETETPRLAHLRKEVLKLYLSSHPNVDSSAGRATELLTLMNRLGVSRERPANIETHIDKSHPYLRFEPHQCIDCRRCLHTCESVQGQFVYGMAGRGADTHLIFGPTERFADSDCVACGSCVDQCPTGALFDLDRESGTKSSKPIQSTCGYCGVGCQIDVEANSTHILRIEGTPSATVNHGHLCVKGRYAHAYQNSKDRLTKPLRRTGKDFVEIEWDEAIQYAADRLREIRVQSGPYSIGAFTSSRSTNEAAYLLQKLFRTALSTNNIDCCARVCHSSTALALQKVTGTGAASASYKDIELAGMIVVAGANATEAHPVVGARIKQAALRGIPLLVIDPRRIELADFATLHLAPKPGTNVALFHAIAKILIQENWIDRKYVLSRTEGWDALQQFLSTVSVEDVSRITGVSSISIVEAARLLGAHSPALFVSGLGLSELTQGVASVMTYCNLGMLTGSIGRVGAGMLPLRGQNNVQGNADMGGMPNQVTGYQPLTDGAVRTRLETLWGKAPPLEKGWTIPEMIDAAAIGRLRALWIHGEDVAQSDPNETHVREALGRLDFLIVQELFFSETAQYAHLILPAAGPFEHDGTFTNGERRIQRVRRVVPPPGEARPDWEIIRDIGKRLGEPWTYQSPSDVMDEIAKTAPALFGGVRYDRLDDNGLQWPCPDSNHPGTSAVHREGFLRGKGLLSTVPFIPSPEHNVSAYPYTLITGRRLEHYNVGTMTRRTPNNVLSDKDFLEIHPDDAAREHIQDGSVITLESRWGVIPVPVQITDRVLPGQLFLTFHFPETHTNVVTSPHVDPQSKCPEYKVTAVRLVPL